MGVTYECPECGATGKDNFTVQQSRHSHRQSRISHSNGRRDEDKDTYHCDNCGASPKGYEVKNRQ